MNGQISPHDWMTLSEYFDGTLDSAEKLQFEARLKQEAALASALHDLQRMRILLRSAPRKAVPHNFTLTRKMVEPERTFSWRLFPAMSFASLAAAILAVVSLFLRQPMLSASPEMAAAPMLSVVQEGEIQKAAPSGEPVPIIIWNGIIPGAEIATGKGGGMGGGGGGGVDVQPVIPYTVPGVGGEGDLPFVPMAEAAPSAAAPDIQPTPTPGEVGLEGAAPEAVSTPETQSGSGAGPRDSATQVAPQAPPTSPLPGGGPILGVQPPSTEPHMIEGSSAPDGTTEETPTGAFGLPVWVWSTISILFLAVALLSAGAALVFRKKSRHARR